MTSHSTPFRARGCGSGPFKASLPPPAESHVSTAGAGLRPASPGSCHSLASLARPPARLQTATTPQAAAHGNTGDVVLTCKGATLGPFRCQLSEDYVASASLPHTHPTPHSHPHTPSFHIRQPPPRRVFSFSFSFSSLKLLVCNRLRVFHFSFFLFCGGGWVGELFFLNERDEQSRAKGGGGEAEN